MKSKILLFLFTALSSAFAAIGDNAPSVPATYLQTHPHLPYPDSAYLAKVCNNGGSGGTSNAGDGCSMNPAIRGDANGWSTASGFVQMRHLLIAYAATKNNGTPNATYLASIQSFGTANWNGSTFVESLALAMGYDWFFTDIGTTAQGQFRTTAYSLMTNEESNYFITGGTYNSPYSDVNYIQATIYHLPLALAIYPDDPTNSLPHLRWSMDYFLNMLLPAWKHAMSGNYCGSGTDASNDCGGGWPDTWSDYEGKNPAMTAFYTLYNVCWANASGRGISNWFTIDNPWLKNLAYWMMYETEPDFSIVPIGDNSRALLEPEAGGSGSIGYLDGLAAIYNDPTLRGWSRLLNWGGGTPNGFEPSTWPYYTPDSSANSTNTRAATSPYRNFPGWGTIFLRTGWTENDTTVTIRYGDGFWGHSKQDAGGFTAYHRGPLAIISGTYRTGSNSAHWQEYGGQAIAENVPLFYDPSDIYTANNNAELYPLCRNYVGASQSVCPTGTSFYYESNDGGQRRVGSTWGNGIFTTSNGGANYSTTGTLPSLQSEPSDEAMWNRSREYYHNGKLIAWATGSSNKYAFAAIDITAAYNNLYSRNAYTAPDQAYTANTSNRTFRATKVVRQFLFIPRGNAAYLVVYDQLNANPLNYTNITKKDLIHSVNQPVIGTPSDGSTPYTISRTETVTAKPFPGDWLGQWHSYIANCPGGCSNSSTQYQYNGQLYGWLTWPQANGTTNCASGNFSCLTNLGGAGQEFQTTDATGTHNWNECMLGQCIPGGIAGSNSETFNITSSSNALLISVNGGANQSITLTTGSAQSCASVIANISATLTGATASCQIDPVTSLNRIALQSNSNGSIGIQAVANSAYSALGFTVGTYTGAPYDEGYSAIADFMHPASSNLTGPHHPGSWRIEETIGQDNIKDQFINVMLLDSATDTNTVSTAPITSIQAAGNGACAANTPGGCYVTTWQDNSNTCTYTVTQPVDGVGATLTVQGAGCSTVIN